LVRLTLALTAAVTLVPLGAGASASLPLVPCTLAGGVAARCGTFTVPENRALANGRTISLRLAVVAARDGGTKPVPLVHITGGPGGSAIADAVRMLSTFSAVNESRDLVLVDQRGTGGSNRIECPLPRRGSKVDLTRPAAVRAYVSRCMAGLDGDPRQYTTVPAMDDPPPRWSARLHGRGDARGHGVQPARAGARPRRHLGGARPGSRWAAPCSMASIGRFRTCTLALPSRVTRSTRGAARRCCS
jgi:hypothetical protein